MPEKSIIGLKKLVAWEVTADVDGGATTYGPVIALEGAIEATVTPDTSEANVQHADDVEFDSLAPDTPYTIEVDVAGVSVANQAKLQGHALDANGGMIIKKGDNPPYFAFAFKSEKADGSYRYVVIHKAKPQFMPRSYKTKEGTTITRQTSKMTLKGTARISDGMKQYIVDGLDSGEEAAFFTAPHNPIEANEIEITTQPADQYLAASDGGTLSVVAEVDGGAPDAYQWYKATGKQYDGVASAYTGNTGAILTIPTSISAGVHYFYCKISNAGSPDVYSDIAVVIVGS